MISDNIKRLRENAGLSQSALARKLGVTRASVNAWEMELSAPTAQYLVALAQLFHTTTDDILGLESEEQIVLRDMNEQEKRLVYDLVSYIAARKEMVAFSGKSSKNNPSEKSHGTKGSAVKKI
jgi:transcriptional regulator with XRE-family HTH domain